NKNHETAQPSQELVGTLGTLCLNALSLAKNRATINVQVDGGSSFFIHEFDVECDRKVNEAETEIARQLWTRGHLKLLKLAALIAVGMDIYEPVITLEVAQGARNMVERDIANILDRFESERVGNDANEQQQCTKVLEMFKDYIYRPFDKVMSKYLVNEAMKRDRVIQWSYLSRRLAGQPAFKTDRMGSSFALKRTLDLLMADGTIVEL